MGMEGNAQPWLLKENPAWWYMLKETIVHNDPFFLQNQIKDLKQQVADAQRALEQYPEAISPSQTVPSVGLCVIFLYTRHQMEDIILQS